MINYRTKHYSLLDSYINIRSIGKRRLATRIDLWSTGEVVMMSNRRAVIDPANKRCRVGGNNWSDLPLY